MKKYARTLDYSKIVALICDGEKKVGSGFFLWSDDESSLYCVTAKHNLDENDNPTIRILGEDKSFSKIISVQGCYSHDTQDVSIFDVVIDSHTETIPNTWIYSTDSVPSNVTLNGFPKKCEIGFLQSSARCHLKHQNALLLEIDSLPADPEERYDEVVGFSGGGCYAEVNQSLLVVGMMFQGLDREIPFKELEAITINPVIELLATEKLPSLPPPCPNYWLEKDKHFKKVARILENQTFSNSFADKIMTAVTINEKISEFIESNEPILFFCGSSGIGKTRSILEHCKALPFPIYYETFYEFKKDKDWILSCESHASGMYITVDEVTFEEYREVDNFKKQLSEGVKLILIGTVSQKQKRPNPYVTYLDDLREGDVIQVLENQYKEASMEELEEIQKLCHFDLRLAVLIAELYFGEQQQPDEHPLLPLKKRSISDLDQWGSVDGILQKTLEAHKKGAPYHLDVPLYVYHLSTVVDVQFLESNVPFFELETLTAFFSNGDSQYHAKLNQVIDYLSDINLGIKRSIYFELSPRALAKMAFEQQGWDFVKYRLGKFLDLIPNDLMRKRFFQRVAECDKLDELKQLLRSWVQEKFRNTKLVSVCHSNITTYMQYVEYFPEIGLGWLQREIVGSSVPITEEVVSNQARRCIVRTCERLANFKEWFVPCEEILFHLAWNETDFVFSNNSIGTWCGLYSPILGNTEISFEERVDLLLDHCISLPQEINTEIFINVFKKVVHVHHSLKLAPPDEVGGILTPQSWCPETVWDIGQGQVAFLEKIEALHSKFAPSIKRCLLAAMEENLQSYYSYHSLPKLKECLDRFHLSQDEKTAFIAKLEQFYYHRFEDSQEDPHITGWISEWSDRTLEGRLKKFLLSRNQIYSDKTDVAQMYGEELQKLTEEILAYPWSDQVLEDIIFQPREDDSVSHKLGESLGYSDTSLHFLNKIDKIKEKGVCPFLNGYFLGAYKRDNKLPNELLHLLKNRNDQNENFIIWATTCFDVTKEGYQKLLRLCHTTTYIYYFSNIQSKDWRKLLSESEKIEILTTVLNTQHTGKYDVFFSIASAWIQEGTSFTEFLQLYLTALEDCSGGYQAHLVTQAWNYFPPEYQERFTELLCKNYRFNDFYNENNSYILEYLKRTDDCQTNSLMMEYLGNALITQSEDGYLWCPNKKIFNLFLPEIVLNWVAVAPRIRAPLIALQLQVPTENDPKIPLLTQEISDHYYSAEVSHSFERGFTFGAYCIGSLYAQKDKLLEFYQQYENSEVILIREWAEYKIGHLTWECRNHEKRIAESKRYE